MRILKFFLLLLVFVSFSIIIAGYAIEERFENRDAFVIDAPPDKVWALVSDPRNTSRWLPPEMAGGGLVEIKEVEPTTATAATPGTAPAAPRTAAVIAAAGDAGPLLGKRFIYRQKDSSTITIEVAERIQGRRAIDRVVDSSIGFEGYFPELAWGFEIAPAEGGKTNLTPVRIGRAGKPWGTIMNEMMHRTGETRKMHAALAKSVEAALKAPVSGNN